MSQFRAKKLDLGCFVNARVIRDHTKRQALRYIIRNTTLPQRARAAAQLQLSQMHCYTRSTQVNNRCIEGGKSRGVLKDFRMARSLLDVFSSHFGCLRWKAIFLVLERRVGEPPAEKDRGRAWRFHIDMFRRLSSSLPKDPEFPADLEKLGYYVNAEDQIRSIEKPDQEFHYFISKNERVLELQREAMDSCIRANVVPRFASLGLDTIPLPLNARLSEPHVPILASSNISTAKCILVYFGESDQDLGLFAYRVVGQEAIAAGSALNFVSDALKSEKGKETAVVISNLGQLVWYRRGARAMTIRSWNALPRKNGVSGVMRRDPIKNRVQGHENVSEHVKRVFEFIHQKTDKAAKIDVVGISEGAEESVKYLDANWDLWKARVRAACIGLGYLWQVGEEVQEPTFKEFWAKRARAYLIHNEPVGTPLLGRETIGCNCFSSGEAKHTECIMPHAYKSMLEFFQLVHNIPGYEEKETNAGVATDGPEMIVKWVNSDQDTAADLITFSMGDEARGEVS
ncbi:MAG: hypothetical protein Q9163_002202 [Psora crenata]